MGKRMNQCKSNKKIINKLDENINIGLRLPLDLLLIHDSEDLEDALTSKWAIEHEHEIFFCKTDDDLKDLIQDFENYKYYEIDDIESDRIKAVIDLLNKAETDNMLSHILDRIVR
jgi:hypothetical protein